MSHPTQPLHGSRSGHGILLGLLLGGLPLMGAPTLLQADAEEASVAQARALGRAFATVAQKAAAAVVFVEVEQRVREEPAPFHGAPPSGHPFEFFGDDFFERFFRHRMPGQEPERPGRERGSRRQGQGSGFLISSDGYILTNHHVVGEADRITVKLKDGREFQAKLVGSDEKSDVGVVKIEAKDLPFIPMGQSSSLEVGEWVLAIGSPFGLSHSITAGIVSAMGRSGMNIVDYEDFIQTDAAINPGNSGGPLVDLGGRAVGINTAIFSRSGGYMGIGFAIPMDMARSIYEQIRDNGSVSRGFLGIVIQDIDPELAKGFGLEDGKGILIAEVSPGSPAERAGLQRGDIVIALDGAPVENTASFRNRVSLTSPGTSVKLRVRREGRLKTLDVELGRLGSEGSAAKPERPDSAPTGPLFERLGFRVEESDEAPGRGRGRRGGEGGLVLSDVDPSSAAAMAGLRPGLRVLEIDRRPVRDMEDFEAAAKSALDAGRILILVHDGRSARYLAFTLETDEER